MGLERSTAPKGCAGSSESDLAYTFTGTGVMRLNTAKLGVVTLLLALAGCGSRPAARAHQAPAEVPQIIEVSWDRMPRTGYDPKAAPVALTATDGTGLSLVVLEARATVEGPLAFTELHFVFRNPTRRVLEGTFRTTLPPGASVHRFAMRIGDALEEGEIVGEPQGRRAFESALPKNVDPALFERDGGNGFRARVFPIQAGEAKEIVLSYSEVLVSTAEPYRLALRGLPALEQLEVAVSVKSARSPATHYHLGRKSFAPDRDFSLPEAVSPDVPAAARADNLVAVRVKPAEIGKPDPIAELMVLVDSSASQYAELEGSLRALQGLLGRLAKHGDPNVRVLCFDQEVREMFRGRASEFGEGQRAAIAGRGAAGATALGKAIEWIALDPAPPRRVLLLGDALNTSASAVAAAVKARLAQAGVERLDVAAVGNTRDDALATALAGAGARPGALLREPLDSPPALERLLRVATATTRIELPGSGFRAFEPFAPEAGREVVAFAEQQSPGPIPLLLDGRRYEVAGFAPASRALFDLVLARLRIDELAREYERTSDESARERLRELLVSESQKAGVLGPFTSFVVLQTEGDYERFGIDRRAPRRVPILDADRVTTVDRVRTPAKGDAAQGSVAADAAARLRAEWAADADGDQIPDGADQCPGEAETYNGYLDGDGCPDRGRIMLDSGDIIILESVSFAKGGVAVLPEAFSLLDVMAEVMRQHPELTLLEVAGFSDSAQGPREALRLSRLRAKAVLDYLVKKGVEPGRLLVRAYGQDCPLDDNRTARGRERNRRVQFHVLASSDGTGSGPACASRDPRGQPKNLPAPTVAAPRWDDPTTPALEGELANVRGLIAQNRLDDAVRAATGSRNRQPRDALAWVALGDALAAKPGFENFVAAARAYGSLIDLDGDFAQKRRAAGGFLESLAARIEQSDPELAATVLEVAVDAYRQALERRPDQPSSHRLLAFALARQGDLKGAFDVLERAFETPFENRFGDVKSLLAGDLKLLAAAWKRRAPEAASDIERRLTALELRGASGPTLRFVSTWETDASNVDLYIKTPTSRLTADRRTTDVRNGFGPELVEVSDLAQTYRLGVVLENRGVQGNVMGKVAIVYHDGHGNLTFDDRPFVLMKQRGYADLGDVKY